MVKDNTSSQKAKTELELFRVKSLINSFFFLPHIQINTIPVNIYLRWRQIYNCNKYLKYPNQYMTKCNRYIKFVFFVEWDSPAQVQSWRVGRVGWKKSNTRSGTFFFTLCAIVSLLSFTPVHTKIKDRNSCLLNKNNTVVFYYR